MNHDLFVKTFIYCFCIFDQIHLLSIRDFFKKQKNIYIYMFISKHYLAHHQQITFSE